MRRTLSRQTWNPRLLASRSQLLSLLALLALFLGPLVGLRPAFAEQTTIGRVTVTDLEDRSFAVSWITDQPSDGYVRYGTDPNAVDGWTSVSDVRGPGYVGYTHYVSVENGDPGVVDPSTTYYFSATSGRTTVSAILGQSLMSVRTPATLSARAPEPNFFSASVRLSDASPAAGVLVFVALQRIASGQPTVTSQQLSGLTDSSGAFSIDVSQARISTSGGLADYFRLSTTSADEKISYVLDAGLGTQVTGSVDGNTTSAGSAAPVQPRVISLPIASSTPAPTASPTSALVLTPPPPLEQTATPAVPTPQPSPTPPPPPTRAATATPARATPAPSTPSPEPATPTSTPPPATAASTPAVTPTVALPAASDGRQVPPGILAVIGAAVLFITTGIALTAVGLVENSRRR